MNRLPVTLLLLLLCLGLSACPDQLGFADDDDAAADDDDASDDDDLAGAVEDDGGALCVHPYGGVPAPGYEIAPQAGSLVVFDSALVPHSVSVTRRERLVVAGWLLARRHAPEASHALLECWLTFVVPACVERERGEPVSIG